MSSKVEEDLSYDLVKIAEANGFTTDLWIRATKNRPYIIVIGQTHFTESDEMTMSSGEVKDSQKRIELLIKAIVQAEKQKKKVYAEGFVSSAENDLAQAIRGWRL